MCTEQDLRYEHPVPPLEDKQVVRHDPDRREQSQEWIAFLAKLNSKRIDANGHG